MSISSSELIFYSSANIPTDDTTTSGGAISTTSRPELTQFSGAAIVQIVSDGADTRAVTVTGRLATGVVDTEVITANGTTPVSGAKTFERIQKLVASATSGTRTISVKEGAGGTVRATISVNETTRHIAFQNSASDPSTTKARSEKVFGKNTNGTLTLTAATVTLTADPTGNITIALAASVDDSGSVANRLASTGLTFSDDSVALTVPGGGNIPAGSAIGVWVLQSLAAAAAATKSTFTLKLQGTTI
jgi:hypothetical protein